MSQSSGIRQAARGAAAMAAALSLAAPAAAQAQQQQQQPQARPPVQGLVTVTMGSTRYQTPDGAVRFVFDRSSGARVALLRFEGDDEVHVLRSYMGARGDEIYRTDDGAIMLRVTPQGGLIVYTRTISTGAPVSEVAAAPPITPEAIAAAQLRERVRLLQIRAARAVGEPVLFVVPAQMSPTVAGLVVDAAERVAEGLGQAPLTTVRRVMISLGADGPRALLRGDTLYVQVDPTMGYAGRPSSIAIRNVVTGAMQGPQE